MTTGSRLRAATIAGLALAVVAAFLVWRSRSAGSADSPSSDPGRAPASARGAVEGPAETSVVAVDRDGERSALGEGPDAAGATLLGRVVLATGDPCPDATIRGTGGLAGQADADGRFRIAAEREREVVLVASAKGLAGRPCAPIRIGDADVRGIELVVEPAASIEGHVTDVSGRPIEGVKVLCSIVELGAGDDWAAAIAPDLMPSIGASTDAAGRFRVASLPEGLVRVSSNPAGFLGVARLARSDEAPVHLALTRLPRVHGRVVDASTGESMPFRTLTLLGERRRRSADAWFPLDDPTCRLVGADGAATFELWPRVRRTVRIEVAADGYAIARSEPFLLRGSDVGPLEIALQPGRLLEGRVVDEAGEPLVGATVSLGASDPSVTADGEGRFAVTVDGTGSIELAVEAAGHIPRRTTLEVADADSDPLEIELLRAGSLVVEVRGAEGSPGALWTSLRRDGQLATDTPFADVGPDGRVAYEALPPGEFEVVLHSGPVVRSVSADAHARASVAVVAGERATIAFDAPPASVVQGVLSLDGAPSPLRRVRWIGLDGSELASSTTDRDGRFVLSTFDAAAGWLEVSLSPRAAAHHRRALDAAAARGVDLDLDLESGRLVGRVADESGGSAPAGTTVLLEALPVGRDGDPFEVATLGVDGDGRFDTSMVIAGPMLITVRAPFAVPVERRPVDVLVGGLTDLGDVIVRPGGDLEVVVRSPDGAIGVRDRISIEIAPKDPGTAATRTKSRTGAGAVTFPGVWAGSVDVRVVAADGSVLSRRAFDVRAGARERLVVDAERR